MEFERIEMLTDTSAVIRLYGKIGENRSTDENLASELNYLMNFTPVDNIEIWVNSGGGDMVNGFGMFSELEGAKKKGVKITTINKGLAGSMALPVMQSGQPRKMVDFGLIMLHNPSGTAPQNVLDKFKDSALVMFESKTSLSKDELSKMMDATTWLNAKQAKKLGFIDEIVKTEKVIDLDIENSTNEEILNVYMNLEAPQQKEIKFKSNNMDSVNMALGLNKNAAEEVVLSEVNSVINRAEGLENQVSALTTDLSEMTARAEKAEKSVLEQEQNAAEILVSNAIEAGKFKEEARDAMVTMAINSPEGFKTLVNSIETPKKVVNIARMIASTPGTDESIIKDGKIKEMTYREMEKKDPKMLASLDTDTKAEFFKSHYGKYPTNYTPSV